MIQAHAVKLRNPLIWVIYSFNLVDYALTAWAVSHGVNELNPLIAPVTQNLILYSLFKIIFVPFLLLSFIWIAEKHPKFMKYTLIILTVWAGIIMLYDVIGTIYWLSAGRVL
jgi:hypothetical protein